MLEKDSYKNSDTSDTVTARPSKYAQIKHFVQGVNPMSQKKYILGAFLLLGVVGYGAYILTQNKSTVADSDFVAGKLLVSKDLASSIIDEPTPGTLPTVSYANYSLYGDGLLICDKRESIIKEQPNREYYLTHTRLTKQETKQAIDKITELGFTNTASLYGSTKYGQAMLPASTNTISVYANDKVRTLTHHDDGSKSPEAYNKADSVLTDYCNTRANEEYASDLIVNIAQGKPITDTTNANATPRVNYSEINISSIEFQEELKASVAAESLQPIELSRIKLSPEDSKHMRDKVYKNTTTVDIEMGDKIIRTSIEPNLPYHATNLQSQTIAKNQVIQNLDNYREKLNKQHISKISGENFLTRISDKVFSKTEAASYKDYKIHVRFLELKDSDARTHLRYECYENSDDPSDALIVVVRECKAWPNYENSAEDEMRSLAGTIENWYARELGHRRYTYTHGVETPNITWDSIVNNCDRNKSGNQKVIDYINSSFGAEAPALIGKYQDLYSAQEMDAYVQKISCYQSTASRLVHGLSLYVNFREKLTNLMNDHTRAREKYMYIILPHRNNIINAEGDIIDKNCGAAADLGGTSAYLYWWPTGYEPRVRRSSTKKMDPHCPERRKAGMTYRKFNEGETDFVNGGSNAIDNAGSYELGLGATHEIAHMFGLSHTTADDGHGVISVGDIMNTSFHPFPDAVDLKSTQKWFLNTSPALYLRYNPNREPNATNTAFIPPSPSGPPPPPRCANGSLKLEWMRCDDGEWDILGTLNFAGKQMTWYKQRGTGVCGMRSIEGIGSAAQGYLYPANCDDYTKVLGWIQAAFIADHAKKAQIYQDTQPVKGPSYGQPITTDPNFVRLTMRTGNMKTQPEWEKPVPAPYLGFLHWFIPFHLQHGLTNYNSTKGYNFYGGMWGWDQGNFVIATNMGDMNKTVNNKPFVYGPFENPGGKLSDNLKSGKAMKVCWNMRDIAAIESGNMRHSQVKLQVYANAGWYKYAEKTVTLSGTDYKDYCIDNIKPNVGADHVNLEYPVTYLNGSVAVTSVSRSIYFPSGNYTINLPSYGNFGKQLKNQMDPLIRQTGVVAALRTLEQCHADKFTLFGNLNVAIGCKLTDKRSIAITSTIFEAPPQYSAGKKICLTGSISSLHTFYGYTYADNQDTPENSFQFKRETLLDASTGRGVYCAQTTSKSFRRLVLGTSVIDPVQPAVIEKVNIQ